MNVIGKETHNIRVKPMKKESNQIFQIAFMNGADLPSHRNINEKEEDEAEVGRKFHFPMKVGDLLEPAYFNRKT